MPNIFDVGVSLSLASNVGAGLRSIARDLLGVRGEIGRTQEDLRRLRSTLLGLGGVMVAGGIAHVMWDAAKAGDQLQQQLQRIRSMGVDNVQVQKDYVAALKAARQVEGTSPSGNLALISMLRDEVGTSANARAILPGVARDEWILRHIGQSTGDIASIMKSIEMLRFEVGKNGQIDPQRFLHALDLFTAGLNLDPRALLRGTQIFQFARMAQPVAGLGGNPEEFIRDYFELMTQMGRTAGRGVAYFGIKLLGGQLTKAQEATLLRLGLVSPSGVGGTKEHPFLKTGAVKGFDELIHKGILAWVRDVLFPAMKVQYGGEPDSAQMGKVLSGLAGMPVTSQRAIATFFNLAAATNRFQDQFDKGLKRLDKTFSDQQNALTPQIQDFDAAFRGLMEVVGLPEVHMAVPFLRDLTETLQDMTLWVGQNQWLPEVLESLGAAIATFAGVEGGALVLRGALGMLRVAIPDLASAFGPFAAGGAAAIALRMLTSTGGLLGLALGLEVFAKAVSDPRLKFLVKEAEALVNAGIAAKFGGPIAGIGAFLWPQGKLIFGSDSWLNWSPGQLLHYLRTGDVPTFVTRDKNNAAEPNAQPHGEFGLPLPPNPPPLPLPPPYRPDRLPLPPTPPGERVAVQAPVTVQVQMPAISAGELETALSAAMLNGLTPETIRTMAALIAAQAGDQIASTVRKNLAVAQHNAARGSMLDHGNAATRVDLGAAAFGGT